MEKELRIKVGKRYLTRSGKVSGIINVHPLADAQYPFWDNENKRSYTTNGKYYPHGESKDDLISEYIEPTKDIVEVRKGFVMAAYKAACSTWQEMIRKELPELFPNNNFKDGDWIKHDGYDVGKFLCVFDSQRMSSGKGMIGFNLKSYWSEEIEKTNSVEYVKKSYRLATEEEVKSALINEAKRRYSNKKAKCLHGCLDLRDVSSILEWKFDGDCLRYYDNNGGAGCCFENGKWAEPLKEQTELTLEQIAEKFGVKVENLRIKDKD